MDALADTQRSRLILVARAQQTSLREVARTHEELTAIGLTKQFLVINGLMPKAEAALDSLAATIFQREQNALAAMPEILSLLPSDHITLKPFNLVGLTALRKFLIDTPLIESNKNCIHRAIVFPNLSDLIDEIAKDECGLIMLMGKGSVGKTTLAAAIAVNLAYRGLPVHLTTSDPAAHLNETLNGAMENMTVDRIDPHIETERYRQRIMETRGIHLDAQGRALLEEDLRSPCTEEIAVFQAFSRVIREGSKKFVVMDTAPTGHTLLLLDATGAYHREVIKKMDKSITNYSTPMMQLQNPNKTKILLVTLAETTPVMEAANLQADLRRAGIDPWAWIINNSVAAATLHSPLLCQRAHNELTDIETVSTNYTKRYAVVPLLKDEPVGIQKLIELSRCNQSQMKH